MVDIISRTDFIWKTLARNKHSTQSKRFEGFATLNISTLKKITFLSNNEHPNLCSEMARVDHN